MMNITFTNQKRLHLLDQHLHLVSDYHTPDTRMTSIYWRLSGNRQWHRWAVPTWRDLIWSIAVSLYLISVFVETVKHGFFFSMGLILSGVALYWIDVLLAAPGVAWLAAGRGNKIDPKTFRMLLTTMVFGAGAYWTIIKAVIR
jgi:hypothetical protein